MMRALATGSYRVVGPEHYGTPKEIWGFRTRRARGGPLAIARAFLVANARLLGQEGATFSKSVRLTDQAGARFRSHRARTLRSERSGIAHVKTIASLGAHHVIFQQRHLGWRVHRAYVTVHIARDGCVYLAKNRAMPHAHLPAPPKVQMDRIAAIARARQALPRRSIRAPVQDVEELWFPLGARLRLAFRVRLAPKHPREEWIVYVDAETRRILGAHDNLSKRGSRRRSRGTVRGRAWVFDPSPVTALGGHGSLWTARGKPRQPPVASYRSVVLHGLSGTSHLDGQRVTTAPSRHRVRSTAHRFEYRASERGFEEVMVYHHIDSAIRYVESLGFRGTRAIVREPLRVNVNGTHEDNSWYSPWERLLTFGTGAIDDAEDGETIIHELGHALQDAIVPDFGQSPEAAAMGEGFGDYFAASVFAERKPERYRTSVMTWDGLPSGLERGLDPPCLRRVDERWTYADFNEHDDEHENGEIWSATLWDARGVLGGVMADRLIIESHFQLDGFTTMERGARAILDADRNLNGGAHQARLRRVFQARGIGPL